MWIGCASIVRLSSSQISVELRAGFSVIGSLHLSGYGRAAGRDGAEQGCNRAAAG